MPRRVPCDECGKTSVLGQTKCAFHVEGSGFCVVDGCLGRVSSYSRSRLCSEHYHSIPKRRIPYNSVAVPDEMKQE